MGPEHLDRAIKAAIDGSKHPLSRYQRHDILCKAAVLLAEHREELARLIRREAGLCMKETMYETGRSSDVLEFAAIEALRDDGQVFSCDISPQGKARKIFTFRQPVQLVSAITPFNHPLNQVAHKVAPAIAAGAPMLLKPSEKTPLTSLRFCEIVYEAGLPGWTLSMFVGDIDDVVTPMITDPRVELVSFTGSVAVGKQITHVVLVHNETTTGMMNPLEEIVSIVKQHEKVLLVDSISAFGGIPLDIAEAGIDYIVSSANKCIQGVPGFGFVIGRIAHMQQTQGWARSLSLDLYDQWQGMENGTGKWRYTSPTHVVRAFYQALIELEEECGIPARYARYTENQRRLVAGMERLGFRCVLAREYHSPIITGFYDPEQPEYEFRRFYDLLKKQGFVIYPGKVTGIDSFRIGTIGHVFPEDIDRLIIAIEASMYWA